MGWGRGLVVLWGLLGTAPALLCPRCDVTSGCRPAPCPSPRAVCRRTTLTALKEGREWRREEAGCDVTGPPDVVITFRSHGELVTLREERWGGGAEGEGAGPGHAPSPPPPESGRPLLCPTCDSSDGSCGRPLVALPCPRPQDLCIDVITRGPPGEGEGRLRGCGRAGACRGLLAFESGNGRGAELQCCESPECGLGAGPPSGLSCWGCDGPAPSGCAPRVLRCGAGRTRCATAWGHGPSGEPWLVRGCATPEWCRSPVGLGGLWGGSVGQGGSMGQEDSVGQEGSMGQGGSVGQGGSMGQEDSVGQEGSMGQGGLWGGSVGQDSVGQEGSMGQEGSVGQEGSMGLRCCRGRFCNSLPGDPSPPSSSSAPPPLPPLPLLLLLLPLLAAPQV